MRPPVRSSGEQQAKSASAFDARLWAQAIASATADAKRTQHGVPTHGAVLARWWIEEYRPARAQRDEWVGSFECVCEWVGVDAAGLRTRLLKEIDAAWQKKAIEHMRAAVYVRRGETLSLASVPVRIGRMLCLGLVPAEDHDEVAGVDPPEKPNRWHSTRARHRERPATSTGESSERGSSQQLFVCG